LLLTHARRLRMLAVCWIAVAGAAYLFDLLRQTRDGLTNGAGRPLGDDFINFWSAAYLAWHGRWPEIYNWDAFHAFQASVVGPHLDFYHFSYPPTFLVLTAPLVLLPYVPGLFAWLLAGWLCFWRALGVALPGQGALLLALATPAVFINAVGGQNGTLTAALLGGGLSLLKRRPLLAGVLLGLLIYKPQLALLLPVALLAGRQFRAIIAAGITAAALVLASLLLFGTEIWAGYFHNVTVLRQLILEDGTGVWHRMLSVFVAARRLGADVPTAYAAQAVIALLVAGVVALAWWRDSPLAAKNAALVLGSCLATPYLQDYDLVVGAFVVVWLAELYPAGEMPIPAAIGAGLLLVVPFVAAALANLTGYALGPLFIAPAFVIAAQIALTKRPGPSTLRPAR
jgi:arabinofuranan 3-O-arabinosyltransferase